MASTVFKVPSFLTKSWLDDRWSHKIHSLSLLKICSINLQFCDSSSKISYLLIDIFLFFNIFLEIEPFKYEWPRQNFFFQYHYNINQASDKNREKYQLGDYELIQYQILQTNNTRTVWQTVKRITNEILGVKGLTILFQEFFFRLPLGMWGFMSLTS